MVLLTLEHGSDVIDYITTASTGNATDFGNLSVGRSEGGGGGNSVRGVFGGGKNASQDAVNTIDYITIASTGNASDFGDLLATNTGTIGELYQEQPDLFFVVVILAQMPVLM